MSQLLARLAIIVTAAAFVAGCGGGGSTSSSTPPTAPPTSTPTGTPSQAPPTGTPSPAPPTSTPTGTPSQAPPTATPTPSPGALTTSSSALSFTTLGASQTFTASESFYTGTFSATIDNPTIATFTQSGNTFTVTSKAVGTATITVRDAAGQTHAVSVTVTTSSGSLT